MDNSYKIRYGVSAFFAFFIIVLLWQIGYKKPEIYINGNPLFFKEAQPYTTKGCMMVPFDEFMQLMGYSVSSYPETNTTVAQNNDFLFEVTSGNDFIKLNQKTKKLDIPIQYKNGKIYAPLTPLVELSGGSIELYGLPGNIKISTRDKRIEQILSSNQNSVFLASNDQKNPLSVWRQPINNSIIETARCIIGGRELTDHQKIIAFINYMNDFQVTAPSDGILEHTLLEKKCLCGNFTNILLALAITQGIPGRVLSMANYPQNDGHSVAELFINGKWEVFDPTYGSFYTSEPDNTVSPGVLSFEELRNGQGRSTDVTCVIGIPSRVTKYTRVYLGPEIYEKAEPAGPIGPDIPFVYPLEMNAVNKSELSEQDLSFTNQGAVYLGAAGICNLQKWSLKGLIPGHTYRFNIIPNCLGGDLGDENRAFEANATIRSGGVLLQGDRVKYYLNAPLKPWEIKFVASDTSVTIIIDHSYRGPEFFYLRLKGYRLEEVT